ncbi:hypothetical protein [Spiroplasma turonicum]|uniref:Transmembrane protein n=1 Tax=Spiroplasma turonicum TaxID=216946 RepID=A0A0K1P624_9MOLU|nr:hypothetical protein [Spiroplasma turonicum]AKU79715.1 hypothetical protein STURON_00469 [Spiroplasma turonicum]ALX70733.1 hypothetical protein STURO_v1c04670 [Spiroplasma turonicum]
MKIRYYLILLITTFLISLGTYFIIKEINNSDTSSNSNIVNNSFIKFKVKYNLILKDETILPNFIKKTTENKTKDINKFLEKENLTHLKNYFNIEEQNEFYEKGLILIMPISYELTTKENRFTISDDYFSKFSIDLKDSTQFKKYLSNSESELDKCVETLVKKYKKNEFVLDFIINAIYFTIY